MRREKQLPPRPPEFLPSTTRAVAWGAMFFAVLALLMSTATLFLTYKDGRLVNNANRFMAELRQTWRAARASRATEEQSAQRAKIGQQLDRYAKMIQDGDNRARFYLDGLRGDLERLRDYGTEKGGAWLADATKTVDAARQELSKDAPAAARRLRDLASQLAQSVQSAPQGEQTPGPGPSPVPTAAASPGPTERP